MTGIRGLLLVVCVLATAPVVAGTVYRCDSADGGRSYTSKRVAGAACKAVSSFTPARNRRPTASVDWIKPPASTASRDRGAPATIADMERAAGGKSAEGNESVVLAAMPAAVVAMAAPANAYRAPRVVSGQVYSFVKDGVRHYTSAAPRGVAGAGPVRTIKYSFLETCFACGARPGTNFGTLRLNTAAYQAEIRAAALQHGVDEAIVRAIIHAESAFNPNALSRVGAQGLMQLMPATARRFGVGNAFDATQNIQGGVRYLAWLLKRFNGDLTLAAAGYNAGEGAVDRYRGVPPYSETRRYVERVGLLADRYRGTVAVK